MEINDKKIWDEYVKKNAADGGLLQGWDWGEFQQAYGRRVFRIGFTDRTNRSDRTDKSDIVYGWQVIEMPLPLGLKYWYVPRPIKMQNEKCKMNNFIDEIIKLAEKEKAVFIRVDQTQDLGLQNFGFKKVGILVQPAEELWLDLSKSEEELLAQMKQKTRYNIKVAEKHNVEIKCKMQNAKCKIDDFLKLVQGTSRRQGIKPHPEKYYEKMMEILGREKMAEIWLAEYRGKVLAGALVTYFNGVATYLHGGSSDEDKNVMATYLLHWEIIKGAKKRGMQFYNFGGVSKVLKSWAGITRFKTGFAPRLEFRRYAEVMDLPVSKFWYGVYRIVKGL